jgi:flagellar protein FlgJ
MRRPEMTPATLPTRATPSNMVATPPLRAASFSNASPPTTPSLAGQGGNFGAAMRQVQADVNRFIARGAPTTASAEPAMLTADGAALRARLAATQVVGGANAPGADGVDAATQQAFLDSIQAHAMAAAEQLGVAPELVAAHAALESGWGQRPLPGHNLFGVKAGSQWQGEVNASRTTEVEHGLAVRKVAQFRAYPDQASAFRDYAGLLLDNPRYRQALQSGRDAVSFARGLAQGGYASDPAYADKLARVAASIAKRSD